MSFDGYTPSQAENMLRAARIVLSGTWSMLPVEVISYDPAEACVDVRPVVRDRDDNGEVIDIPDVRCLPVLWPFLGGGYSGTFPLSEGDTGIALFASRSISAWVASGEKGADPEGSRQGALMDGIFIPGLRPLNSPPASAVESGLHIGLEDGTARLSILYDPDADIPVPPTAGLTGEDLYLGAPTATDFVALAGLVLFELQKQRSWAATHVHPAPGGTTSAPSVAPPVVDSVASAKVRSE